MEEYIGMIRIFGGQFEPRGWAFCAGQTLAVSEHSALFYLIGTTYGGNGKTTFMLPDLRGAVPIGASFNSAGPAGLTMVKRGQVGGELTHALTVNEMPRHEHALHVNSAQATLHSPMSNASLAAPNRSAGRTSKELLGYSPSLSSLSPMNADVIGNTGDGTGHNNMMPTTFINYIICLNGTFPQPG